MIMKNSSALIAVLLCLFVACALSCTSDNDCSGNSWCSACGTCTSGAVGVTCCSNDDCSGSNCCDYCTHKCTATTSHCNSYTCPTTSSTTKSSTTKSSTSTTKSATATTKSATSTTKSATSTATTSTTGSTNPNYNKTISNVFITSYGWNDNDDGSGSYGNDIIAFPNVRHGHAVETSGTYADPCTFATDQAELAAGSIIYVPHVRKYYIMEDECVECDEDWRNGRYRITFNYVDLWIGPDSATIPSSSLYNCENAITKNSGQIIINPDPNLPVTTTKIFSNGVCRH